MALMAWSGSKCGKCGKPLTNDDIFVMPEYDEKADEGIWVCIECQDLEEN